MWYNVCYMSNPFEGLPRQEAKRQMIDDSIESNRKMDLEDNDYEEIYEALMHGGYTDRVDQIFKRNRLSSDEWNSDPKLDEIRKEILKEAISQGSDISYIDYFLSFTKFNPKWEEFESLITWRYCQMIENAATAQELKAEYEYFGVPIDWNNKNIKESLFKAYNECFAQERIEQFMSLIALSGIRPDWEGEWKDRVTDKIIEILDDFYESDVRMTPLIELTEGEIDWEGRLKPAVNNKFISFFDRNMSIEIGWLEEISGIKPDWEGELKQEVYGLISLDLKSHSLSRLEKCLEILDYRPDFENELRDDVIEAYKRILTERPFDMYKKLEELHQVVGFLPDFQRELPTVCGEYLIGIFKNILYKSNVDKVKEFIEYIGYRPKGVKLLDEVIKKSIASSIEYGNYSILLDLHEVWNIGEYFGDPDLKKVLNENFIKCLDSAKDEEVIKRINILEKVSGIPPDWQGELHDELKSKMQSAFVKNNWNELKRLQEVTGVSFVSDDETRKKVLDGLNSCFEHRELKRALTMQEVTGVSLDYTGEKYEEVQRLYRSYLGLGESGFRIFDFYNTLHELSGVELAQLNKQESAEVLKKIESDLETANIKNLKQMIEATKFDFNWKEYEESVDKAYIKLLKKQDFTEISDLKKISGFVPDWNGKLRDEVMDLYIYLISSGRQSFTDLEKIQEFTSVAPDWEGELKSKVEDIYGGYVSKGYFVGLQRLQKLSGIEPNWEGELKPKVIDYYTQCAEGGSYQSLKILQDLSRVQPDWEGKLKPMVMKSYGKYISQGSFDKIQELQDLSRVQPDWEGELRPLVIGTYFQKAAGNRSKESFIKLEEVTGISYNEAIKDAEFWNLVITNINQTIIEQLVIRPEQVDPEIHGAFERSLKRHYEILLNLSAESKKYFDFVEFCIIKFGIKPLPEQFVNLVQKALNDSGVFNKLNILLKLCNYRGAIKFKTADVKGKAFNARQIALMYALDMLPKEEEARREFETQLESQNNNAGLVKALINARGVPSPSNRDEYCPWKNELQPLLLKLNNKFVVDSAYNVPAMVDYVQRFGMKNLPVIADISMDLYALKEKLADKTLNEEKIKELMLRFSGTENGIKLHQFLEVYGFEIHLSQVKTVRDIDKIYNLLERVARELKEAVLEDRMPNVLEQSPITMELFNAVMVRSGRWAVSDHGYTREVLMAKWRKFKDSGKAELPTFYRSRTYQLKCKQQASLDMLFAGGEIADQEIRITKLKETKKEEKEAIYGRDEYNAYLAPFYNTLSEIDRLGEGLGGELMVLANAIATLKTKLDAQRVLIEQIGGDPKQQKKKLGMQKGLEKQEELLQKIGALGERENIFTVLRSEREDLRVKIDELNIDQEKAKQELPDLENYLEKLNDQLVSEGETKDLKKQKKDLQKEIQKLKSKINQSGEGWRKDLERLNGLLQTGEDGLTNEAREYLQHQRMLTAIACSFDQKILLSQLGDSVRMLTLRMAELESQGHVEAIREAHKMSDKEGEFKAWKAFFQEELLEHFIDPDYVDESRRVAMTSQANALLETVWRLNNIRQKSIEAMGGDKKKVVKHPFVKAVWDVAKIDAEIKALEEGGVDALAENVEVTYSPCQGLGRIFAGDVGDACYTSYRHAFADGDYPNLHALILSKKEKGTDDIKLLGSVLLIDGMNIKGKKYLFARAVNPMDTVLKREIKAEEFLQGLLDYLQTTADEAGFDEAVLCVDTQATASGSNRQEMFDAMVKAAKDNKWPIADELERTPETNFKYRVWNTRSTRVYRIWQREPFNIENVK
ncbi:MAG: hypothetical protein P1P90_03465 [Patescibacteria group bacterium]|nr:hypothetical protein [Patescibacteria group bacterium]